MKVAQNGAEVAGQTPWERERLLLYSGGVSVRVRGRIKVRAYQHLARLKHRTVAAPTVRRMVSNDRRWAAEARWYARAERQRPGHAEYPSNWNSDIKDRMAISHCARIPAAERRPNTDDGAWKKYRDDATVSVAIECQDGCSAEYLPANFFWGVIFWTAKSDFLSHPPNA